MRQFIRIKSFLFEFANYYHEIELSAIFQLSCRGIVVFVAKADSGFAGLAFIIIVKSSATLASAHSTLFERQEFCPESAEFAIAAKKDFEIGSVQWTNCSS